VYEQKKSSGPAAASADIAGAAAGVRSNTFILLPFSPHKEFRSQQQAVRARGVVSAMLRFDLSPRVGRLLPDREHDRRLSDG
jgi:hypothetical protein